MPGRKALYLLAGDTVRTSVRAYVRVWERSLILVPGSLVMIDVLSRTRTWEPLPSTI